MILRPVSSRITHRTANDKTTRRIDVVLHARRIVQPFGHNRLDDPLHDAALNLLTRDVGLCWVETTMVSMRIGFPFRYSTVT